MRIFVTGMGAISSLGTGLCAHRQALRSGRSGVKPLAVVRSDLPAHASGGNVDSISIDKQPRAHVMLAGAVAEAFSVAGLPQQRQLPVYVGSAHGNLDCWQTQRRGLPGMSVGLWDMRAAIAGEYVVDPRITCISTACTASSVATGMALAELRSGRGGLAMVAGVEVLTPFLYRGFESLRSLAVDNCRPFDAQRAGLTLGEGAAALILESEAHMQQRGGTPLAELCGYGFAADGTYLTAPDPRGSGAADALRQALDQAGLSGLPGYLNAHGTGTKLNDRMECMAVQRVFQQHSRHVPVTSTKPLTGHMCGAAGVIELVASVLSLESGFIPAIHGFREAESEFADLDFVSGESRQVPVSSVVSMNSGFGGTNTAIVLRREWA